MTESQIDFEKLRLDMVSRQLRDRGIKDERVLRVMGSIPREIFVDEPHRAKAYEDNPLPIPCAQTISQPYMVAIMSELLELTSESSMLEIGSGTGYQAAVLGCLAKNVVTIERHEALAKLAAEHLQILSIENVLVRVGDGTLGYPDEAPFDGIIVTAGGPDVPKALITQLAVGGRLVCPVGDQKNQKLQVIHRTADGFEKSWSTKCRFVPLIGQQGWSE